MLWFGISLFALGCLFFIAMGVFWYLRARSDYQQDFHALCPETRKPVDIRVDAALAARSMFAGRKELKIVSCTRWPERQGCDQGCAPQVDLLGDSRSDQQYPAFGLQWYQLKKNNPVQMTPELYERMTQQLASNRLKKIS